MNARAQQLPRTRTRVTARAGILFGLVLLVGLLSIVPLRQFLGQRGRVAELERDVRILRQQNQDLEARVERLRTPEEVERLARECLGMVRPGETAVIRVPDDGAVAPPARC